MTGHGNIQQLMCVHVVCSHAGIMSLRISSAVQVYDRGYGRTQVLPMHDCSLCLPGIVLATEYIGMNGCMDKWMDGWMERWMNE